MSNFQGKLSGIDIGASTHHATTFPHPPLVPLSPLPRMS